ncbi:hypothetical protein DdX_00204 [Ditylenchus destructor]|uniref:Uncharacterized protein n=1 Tax=Ditylenchus destructor TaxID=166010 RepID=A0AAD4NIA7_9BILA|nr:hypothetical protein DdX_00204 [Ditylenchus destructor]
MDIRNAVSTSSPSQYEEKKVLLALINLFVGVGCTVLYLTVLSVVPDCVHQLTSQFLTFFVTQVCLLLVAVIVSTLSIAYMLAANVDGLFLDEQADGIPGYIFIFCVATISLLQLFSSIQRYFGVIWPALYTQICTRRVSFLIILGSFLFGAYCFVRQMNSEYELRYNLIHLRWMFESHLAGRSNIYLYLFGCCTILTILCTMALVRVFYDGYNERREAIIPVGYPTLLTCRRATTVICFLLTDLSFAFLLVYAHRRAVPQQPSKFRGIITSSINYYDGFIQTYLLASWIILSAMFNYKSIRQALGIRAQLMVGKQPSVIVMSPPIFLHADSSWAKQVATNGRFAALPIFKFGHKESATHYDVGHNRSSIAMRRSSFDILD